MDTLLPLNAILLALSLVQALLCILFFRPGPALWVFFFQTLFLTVSTVVIVGFDFENSFICGWICVVLYIYLGLIGIRHMRKRSVQKL
ncbi:MAG: hypothetical protein ABIK28_10970 [Planctomycetota bacterium]